MNWSSFVIPLFGGPTTVAGFCAAAGVYAFFFLLLWVIFLLRFKAGPSSSSKSAPPKTWALKCAMLVHHVVVGPLALLAALQDPVVVGVYKCLGCAAEAWNLLSVLGSTAPPAYIQALMPITAGYMVADLILLPSWSLTAGSATENLLMVVHHLLSLMAWPITLYFNYCARYVLILLAYEISSVFLTINWLLSNSGRKRSVIYKVNGFTFTASFVVVRVLGALPQLRSLWEVPPWQRDAVRARSSVTDLRTYQLLALYTLIIPHVLNLFWGVKVVKGFVAISLQKEKKESKVELLPSAGQT